MILIFRVGKLGENNEREDIKATLPEPPNNKKRKVFLKYSGDLSSGSDFE